MLHASFDVWYSCLLILRDTNMQKTEDFVRFCAYCDDYYRLSQDVRIVHEHGDVLFTREHYEMLSRYLHNFVMKYNRELRRDCPEWAFVLSEFHNFVIDHEMQRLQAGWVYGRVGQEKNLLFRIQSL